MPVSIAIIRDPTRANHTATHLLNFALREVVAEDVDQKGSLVAPDRLRFDFSCPKALTNEQIEQVERIVNDKIEENLIVYADTVPLDLAKRISGPASGIWREVPRPGASRLHRRTH
jgi:alanyl-tRNA synthetase